MSEKECKGCGNTYPLNTDNFYMATKKAFATMCKRCQNLYRASKYEKKGGKKFGFAKLSKETQEAIKEDMKNGVANKDIASKYDIKYPTFLLWKRKGIMG